MPPAALWSSSPAPWEDSGSGSGSGSGWGALDEELALCAAGELPYARVLVPALYLAACALGLPGNALVLRLLAGRRRGPRVRLADTFTWHLAAADLGLLLTLPLWAAAAAAGGRWPFGRALCKLSSFAVAASRCAGALLLAGLAADRYVAVVRPVGARPLRSPRCARSLCRAAWAAALLAGLPALAARDLQPRPGGGSQCEEGPADAWQAIGLGLLLLTCALPLAASLLCYCRLGCRLRRRRTPAGPLRMVCAVEGAFVGAWLPFAALRAALHLARLRALPVSCALLRALRGGLALATCLAFAHGCANPLIYLLLDRSFRARAWRLARRRLSSASSRSEGDPSAEGRCAAGSGGRARAESRNLARA
ncbi:unnamed protein product [Pipistrellus nathusii]|uniref:G-protein coupled receptors family 1 profile domain-containing protein n=1 Tax=Pipistrellus nathusii TaxID=59473 RepID=A0ABN9ZZ13_PIPNA